ncbi:MAG TPA: AsmA family protein [Terriglobales bacterium]|nr:AsmA family protein [Terriglobales bacterium]
MRSRRGVAAIAALLLILFLFRPGVYKLRIRIAGSIGSALGRRVVIDNVSLHFLPRPGFDLEGLVIYDDPAFSAEPMIRAQEVSAAIRFRSLLRGRLEIATLSASEPSVNLVRNNEGRWNLASLLERNAQIPAAPTGKSASERRPAFPYLEASNARVNFKLGQTKKSYALMNADVALWQDSENSWAARIKAEPVRTDFNLTDTGLVQINATWQRAQSLRLTPVQITVQWRNGQLGQITQLLSGKDRGWRGGVNFTANLSGTAEALRIESQTEIEDFHRYDIVGSESLRLGTACSGKYSASTSSLDDLLCESPIGGGVLRLKGGLSLATQVPAYDLTLSAEKVPVTSVVRLLRRAKKQVRGDLTASGLLNAEFRATRNRPAVFEDARYRLLPQWSGTGSAINVRISSSAGNSGKDKDEVALGAIPLTLVGANERETSSAAKPGHAKTQEKDQEPAEPHLRIGLATLAMNGAAPVNAGGWISLSGYRFFLRGDMGLKELFRLEDILALPVARPAAEGEAKLDVSVSGPWQGFAAPTALGTAQLRNVRAEMRGLNTPLEIGSAIMFLTPDAVLMQKISARAGSTHWSGGVTSPRHCAAPGANSGVATNCVFQFDLTADQLSTGDLAEWFTPHPAKRPWYRILNSSEVQGPSPLLAIQAHGSFHVGRFGLKRVVATQVVTQVEVDRGKITLAALSAQLLQGTHQGNWIIDLSNRDASVHDVSAQETSSQTLRYRGTGTLQDISLAQVGTFFSDTMSDATNDAWIAGTADGKFEVEGSGDSFRDLLARSDGKLQFVMRNGSLHRIEIPGSPVPLPVHRFAGELRLKKGTWELAAGRLESRDGIYQVSGTASPGTGLDFRLTRGDEQSWTLTGTFVKPHVAPGSRTVAKRTDADTKSAKP